jgi:hypothetical protein
MEQQVAALQREVAELRAAQEAVPAMQLELQQYREGQLNAPKVIQKEAISQIRHYDGKTDVHEFLLRLETDVNYLNLDERWIISNIDRFLDGDASDYWSTRFPKYNKMLVDGDDAEDVWVVAKGDLEKFFDHSNRKAGYRAQNSSLKFNFGDDVQSYVTRKIKVLSLIDENMSSERVVHYLKSGLPATMQLQLSTHKINTCEDFLSILASMVETAEKLKREGKLETRNDESKPMSNSNSYYGNRNYQQPQRFIHPPAVNNSVGAQPPANRRAENGAPICNYCNIPGHIFRFCRKRLGNVNYDNAVSSSQASANPDNVPGN